MTIHTLIPEAGTYGVVMIMVLGYGSFLLPLYLQSFPFIKIKLSLVSLHAWVKGFIVLIGLIIFPINHFFSSVVSTNLISTSVGIIIGLIMVKVELYINRSYHRKNNISKRSSKINNSKSTLVFLKSKQILSLSKNNKKIVHVVKANKQQVFNINYFHYNSIAIILTAFFEEIIFRGFLIHPMLINIINLPKFILYFLCVLIFGLSHIALGWIQVGLKTLYGFIALVLTLFFETILPAIAFHVVINTLAYSKQVSTGVFNFKETSNACRIHY